MEEEASQGAMQMMTNYLKNNKIMVLLLLGVAGFLVYYYKFKKSTPEFMDPNSMRRNYVQQYPSDFYKTPDKEVILSGEKNQQDRPMRGPMREQMREPMREQMREPMREQMRDEYKPAPPMPNLVKPNQQDMSQQMLPQMNDRHYEN